MTTSARLASLITYVAVEERYLVRHNPFEVRVEVRLEVSADVGQHFAIGNAGQELSGFAYGVTSSLRASWTSVGAVIFDA